jgi:hypothetical protein
LSSSPVDPKGRPTEFDAALAKLGCATINGPSEAIKVRLIGRGWT